MGNVISIRKKTELPGAFTASGNSAEARHSETAQVIPIEYASTARIIRALRGDLERVITAVNLGLTKLGTEGGRRGEKVDATISEIILRLGQLKLPIGTLAISEESFKKLMKDHFCNAFYGLLGEYKKLNYFVRTEKREVYRDRLKAHIKCARSWGISEGELAEPIADIKRLNLW